MRSSSSLDHSRRVVEHPLFAAGFDQDGFVYIRFSTDGHVALQEMKYIEQVLLEITGRTPFKLIMDVRNRYLQFDREARKYAASAAITKILLGEAVLLNNLPNRLLFNFYLNFDKPNYPIKAFSDRPSAVQWLNKL